jgi:hemerythrin-like metal-binding protein
MIIEWTEQITSGIEEIDRQHQQIISLLNRIVYLHEAPDSSKQLIFTLLEFSEVIHEHFDYEEKLLAENGFKDLKNHKAGHEEISDLINSVLIPVMLNDEGDVPAEPLNNIVRWFDTHLKTEDTRYFQSIKKSQGFID